MGQNSQATIHCQPQSNTKDSYQYYFQAFKGMKQLRKVTLDHNKITEIQPFAFKVYTF